MSSDRAAATQTAAISDPSDLSRGDYVAALKKTLQEVKGDDVPSLAAGVAFRIFLSLFPSMIAAVAVVSLVIDPGQLERLVDALAGVLPEAGAEVVRNALTSPDEERAGMAALAGVAAGLFAATSAAVALMKALSRAYDVPETRKFVKQRVVALFLVLALLAALIALVALLVVGPQLQEAIFGDLPGPLAVLAAVARGLLALALLAVLFAFVYWLGPNRDQPRWVWMSPGAALGVVGWLLVAGGFTLYAQTAGNYSATYGVFAGVAVLLIWLQLSMLVLLVGAEFNAEVERMRALYGAVGEGAGFAIPAAGAALLTGDSESGRAAMVAGATEAPRTGSSALLADDDATVEISLPPPVSSAPAPVAGGRGAPSGAGSASHSSGPPRRLAAVSTAMMAVAVFLGFARRGR